MPYPFLVHVMYMYTSPFLGYPDNLFFMKEFTKNVNISPATIGTVNQNNIITIC